MKVDDLGSAADILGDYWPGIQIYYPPVKYAPSLGIYEDLEQAARHDLLDDLRRDQRLIPGARRRVIRARRHGYRMQPRRRDLEP